MQALYAVLQGADCFPAVLLLTVPMSALFIGAILEWRRGTLVQLLIVSLACRSRTS